jgi:hypothetical protein
VSYPWNPPSGKTKRYRVWPDAHSGVSQTDSTDGRVRASLLAEHPLIRNRVSDTSANMFEVEKPPAVSYV